MISAKQLLTFVLRSLDEEQSRIVLSRSGIEVQVGVTWVRWEGAQTVDVVTGEYFAVIPSQIRGMRLFMPPPEELAARVRELVGREESLVLGVPLAPTLDWLKNLPPKELVVLPNTAPWEGEPPKNVQSGIDRLAAVVEEISPGSLAPSPTLLETFKAGGTSGAEPPVAEPPPPLTKI